MFKNGCGKKYPSVVVKLKRTRLRHGDVKLGHGQIPEWFTNYMGRFLERYDDSKSVTDILDQNRGTWSKKYSLLISN